MIVNLRTGKVAADRRATIGDVPFPLLDTKTPCEKVVVEPSGAAWLVLKRAARFRGSAEVYACTR